MTWHCLLCVSICRSCKQLLAPGVGHYQQWSRCNGRTTKLAILGEDLAENRGASGILKWARDQNSSGDAHRSPLMKLYNTRVNIILYVSIIDSIRYERRKELNFKTGVKGTKFKLSWWVTDKTSGTSTPSHLTPFSDYDQNISPILLHNARQTHKLHPAIQSWIWIFKSF